MAPRKTNNDREHDKKADMIETPDNRRLVGVIAAADQATHFSRTNANDWGE